MSCTCTFYRFICSKIRNRVKTNSVPELTLKYVWHALIHDLFTDNCQPIRYIMSTFFHGYSIKKYNCNVLILPTHATFCVDKSENVSFSLMKLNQVVWWNPLTASVNSSCFSVWLSETDWRRLYHQQTDVHTNWRFTHSISYACSQ